MFIGCYIVSLFYFCGWLSLRNVLKYEMCEIVKLTVKLNVKLTVKLTAIPILDVLINVPNVRNPGTKNTAALPRERTGK